ncbi:MAG: glycosyltransferase family 2 protein [Clostridia bacterium]|nr:glycosyltransferase family 2 protein [Clostridia bacterium]
MKYSFLVPVYNVEKYLPQCIESMLGQTYRDFEIILVDDGSTDSSGKICDDYKEKYPDIIKVIHKSNEGLVSAREWGIQNANGEICLFVDSDDYVESNLLESVNEAFISEESIDIVVFNLAYFEDSRKIPRKASFCDGYAIVDENNKKDIYEALMFSVTVSSLCLKAIRASLLKKDTTNYSLYYENSMGEDQFRSIHLFTLAEKICYINKPLYCYRVDNFSISRNFDYEKIAKKNMLYIYYEFLNHLPIWGMDNEETVARLQAQWLNVMIHIFNQYYKSTQSFIEQKKVIDFNWCSFLPDDLQKSNSFINNSTLEMFELICKKSYRRIRLIFLREKLYKKIKSVLR